MTLIDLKTVDERGWDTIAGGYKGIIIYKESSSSYIAYERACPYDPLEDCSLIEVEVSGVTVIDSCCDSRYLMMDGTVFSGPSLMSLKRYNTYYDGQRLNIRN
jgi:nitrite reductase/ring-hydroxylating ferredoxin subunit